MPEQTVITEEQRADMHAHSEAIKTELVRRLGPGETPKRAEDIVHPDGRRRHGEYIGSPSIEEATAIGNPAIGYDSSGNKLHPSDAFSKPAEVGIEQTVAVGGDYRIIERIDQSTGELVRTKLAMNGEVLDEQREPAAGVHAADWHTEEQSAAFRRQQAEVDRRARGDNGPVY